MGQISTSTYQLVTMHECANKSSFYLQLKACHEGERGGVEKKLERLAFTTKSVLLSQWPKSVPAATYDE